MVTFSSVSFRKMSGGAFSKNVKVLITMSPHDRDSVDSTSHLTVYPAGPPVPGEVDVVGDVLGSAARQPRHVPGLAGEHCQQLEPVTRAPDGEGVALVSGLKII